MSDFHILQASGERVVAVRAEQTDIEISTDGGRSFETLTPPDTPLDVAFDPDDPARMAIATAQGVFTSADGGGCWRPRDPVAADQLAWAASNRLYRADPGGLISVSADGGRSWEERGEIGIGVNELASDAAGALYASVPEGEVKRSSDGGASWKRYLKLR